MSLETWAVAAVAIVDVEGTPLLLRTYTSPKDVLNSPAAPLHAHLYVGPEDVIKLHFVLFASLDRCEDMREMAALPSTGAAAPSSAALVGGGTEASLVSNKSGESSITEVGGVVAGATPATASMANAPAANTARLISPTTDARFLGKLLESHRLRSYGFRSATGIHTLLVTVGSDAPADAMVPLCRALYECASAALCNPFRSPAQCWRAQEQLLWRAPSSALGGETAGAATSQLAEGAEGKYESQRFPPCTQGRDAADAARWTSVLSGAMEWSWPRPAPTSAAALTAEPTLALSRTFNTQLEKLLSSFTVTARSCIVR
ncbi:Sedlin N-inal conserved region containing protein [Leishmania donovani]|uniref:Sedlin_N-inal_conserved_region_containing_protein _putative/Pfam:PF04628 n=1 Tax=Leishmania donovani TaxID=5661 RepID=A0A6J8FDL7_LEIDO|nr:Sedlin N-inal conserved region containing protein [Leishmania donovani]VDZ45642.1 Sedlin_N-inal_conserved_region_containing_protein_putative/Pfam:PF04628 [Leishmania donovani]